eukprot:scaffold66363_cov14-Prasinocladus_malaysianus.AAC.1
MAREGNKTAYGKTPCSKCFSAKSDDAIIVLTVGSLPCRVLNRLLADVFIFTDHMSGKQAGLSPGYGVTLVGETTTGCLLSAEFTVDAGA